MNQTLDTQAQAIIDNIPLYFFPAAPAGLCDVVDATALEGQRTYAYFHDKLGEGQAKHDAKRQRVIELSTQE